VDWVSHGKRETSYQDSYVSINISLRRIARLMLAACLYYSGILRTLMLLRRRLLGRREAYVLCLHRVLSDAQTANAGSLPGMVLEESTFAALLEFLRRHFTVISLQEFLQEEPGRRASSKPLCLITFDDGWKDNYTTAFRWLRKFDLPAVVFLVTGKIGSKEGFWVEHLSWAWRDSARSSLLLSQLRTTLGVAIKDLYDAVERLKQMPAETRARILAALDVEQPGAEAQRSDAMLAWEDILTMERGGVACESHTDTHPLLVYEDDVTVARELQTSKSILEAKLGRKVRAFAYPNGAWDGRVRSMVQDAGYECAFTTQRGWYHLGDDRYTIPRIMLHEGKVTGLSGKFSPAMLSLSLMGWR